VTIRIDAYGPAPMRRFDLGSGVAVAERPRHRTPGSSEPDESRRPFHRRLPSWVAPLLLGALCLVVYNANLRTIGSGDTLPARYIPLVVLHDHTLDLAGNRRLVAHGHRVTRHWLRDSRPAVEGDAPYFAPSVYWTVRAPQGNVVSLYPVLAPLLAAPLYVPAVLWLDAHGWQQPQVDRAAEIMEKFSASLFAAIASVLMFLLLRREGNRWALPLTLAFAFGTNTWVISSQALWQHGTAELLITLALLLVTARTSPLRVALLGFVCVLIAANRQPDVLLAAAFPLFAVWRCKRDVVWLLAGGALPTLALLAYNVSATGQVIGGYAVPGGDQSSFFQLGVLGVPGLLVSPTRGLLVFTPFLVFVVVGLRQRLRKPGERQLAIALGIAAVAQFLVYSQIDWRGGVAWGPRYLTDLLPILVWMLAPAPLVMGRAARGALVALIVVAVGVQVIGAFWYTKASDDRIFAGAPHSMRAAWDPANAPFVAELRHARAPWELQCGATGSIDRPVPPAAAGGRRADLLTGAAVEGWALTCGRTPAQVVLLVDGRVIGATSTFAPRPDVGAAMNTSSPSGWSVTANTHGLSPGPHVLQLATRVEPRSDIRIVREQAVDVPAPASLGTLAARAAQRLRDDQAGPGYWLTSFTSGPQYAASQKEMNTYVTSVLVDLLAPVARQQGLAGPVARARRHLAAQIEPSGLVRYHGLPDAPTIGTLGCVITPDADDTALAWRISGSGAGDPRARRMLSTLARYRDGRGLYRTWLAQQDRYRCLDPGTDPDPADLTIQTHVYLMLRQVDPPAASRLCGAMRRVAQDRAVWVYYAKTALVPYLRAAEVERLGCALPLPAGRLARPVPGQEWWSEVVRRLVQTGASRPDPEARQEIRDVLSRLASDDFALLRGAPPLLYHNDLSATVNRYYWSEDAGYAMWLRLYAAVAR
jgi:hypothetical protein